MILHAGALTATGIHDARHVAGWVLLGVAVAIWIGWSISASLTWRNIIATHVRVGYLVLDVLMVAPLCFASGWCLLHDLKWAPPLLLLGVGAGSYDVTHTLIYFAQVGFGRLTPKRGWWWWWAGFAIAIFGELSGFVLIARHEILVETTANAPLPTSQSHGGDPLLAAGLALALGAAISMAALVIRPPAPSGPQTG